MGQRDYGQLRDAPMAFRPGLKCACAAWTAMAPDCQPSRRSWLDLPVNGMDSQNTTAELLTEECALTCPD